MTAPPIRLQLRKDCLFVESSDQLSFALDVEFKGSDG